MNALDLVVENLCVEIDGKTLLDSISFTVKPGQRVGFIGGSGSGKTLTALAVCGLLPPHASVSGSVKLGGKELIGLTESELAQIRGDLVGMVFQEPKSVLNPLKKMSKQVIEALTNHYSLNKKEKRAAALRIAKRVGLEENTERILNSYPHEISGGQRQRVAIAAAISANPGLLFADEPTTALDVTVQKGIIELFLSLAAGKDTSLVFITHDLAVLAQVAELIYVFDAGKIIETGTVTEILERPRQKVTQELILAAKTDSVDELLAGGGPYER